MKPFVVTTCVWGDLHIEAMTEVMFPTLLAKGNLPALSRLFDVTYRISTTHKDARYLNEHPLIGRLKDFVRVELVVATEESSPEPIHHVNWYHQAIREARRDSALLAFLPPDVAWSSSTIGRMGERMAEGRLGTAMPYLRVVTETILPALKRLGRTPDGSLDISGRDLVRLGMSHMHPLSAVAVTGSRHGRPSLEKLWPVKGEGLLLRNMVRELFSFDPSKIEITHLWYAGEGTKKDEIHIVTDSDEMLFLSLAPLRKDVPLFIQGHVIDGIDMALSSLHPLNFTPLNTHFAKQSIRLHYADITPRLWKRREIEAARAGKAAIIAQEAIQIWKALKEKGGCSIACKLIASALHSTVMTRRWPLYEPLEIIVPTDIAFRGTSPLKLLAVESADQLYRFILDHVKSRVGMVDDAGAGQRSQRAEIPSESTMIIPVGRHKIVLTNQLVVSPN